MVIDRGVALACTVLVAALGSPAHAQDEDEGGSRPRPVQQPADGTSGAGTSGGSGGGAGGAARGATTPRRVYVISVAMEDGLEAVAQRAGAAARATLRGIDGADWRHADELFLGYDESALAVLGRARGRLAAGRQAYLNLDLQVAIEQLTGAVADFDAAAAALEDPSDLGEALLFLGASLAFEGRERDANRIFTRLHVQMPHVTPDPNLFNPDVLAMFEAARPRDAGSPSASITIESNPPGAIAYVDFLARGVTPITVPALRGGEHVVRVTRAGAAPFVQPVTVRPGRPAQASAYLVDDDRSRGMHEVLGAIRDADVSELAADSAIRRLAETLDVERIGVIRATSAGDPARVQLELLVFDVTTGRRLVRGAGAVPTGVGDLEHGVDQLVSGALQAALTSRQAADTEVAPALGGAEPHPVVPPPAEAPLIEQWWFWAAIGGAAVVVVAVGVGVGVATQGPGLGHDQNGYVVLEF